MLILSLGSRLLSTCCELGLFPRIERKGSFCLSPLALPLHPAEMAAVEMAVQPFSTLGWEQWE